MSALLGRMPSAVGYQPNLATEMAGLQERITSTKKGSITSLQAVFVPADDYTDPAPATTFAHLDSTIRLEREHRRAGHLPGGRPADLDVARARPARRRPGALRRRPRDAARPAALPRPPGHHRDPRHRRAVRGGQGDRRPGAPPAALHEPAVLRRRGLHRPARQVRADQGHGRVASRRSSRARPTRCPSRPSSSPARSTTSARTPRSWRAEPCRSCSRSSRRSGSRTRTRSTPSRCPGSRASWASCRTTRRWSRRSASASCASARAARRSLRDRRRLPPGPAGQGRGHGRDGRHGVARSTSRRPRRPGARPSAPSRPASSEGADLAAARAQLQQALLRIRVAERRHREGPRRG